MTIEVVRAFRKKELAVSVANAKVSSANGLVAGQADGFTVRRAKFGFSASTLGPGTTRFVSRRCGKPSEVCARC